MKKILIANRGEIAMRVIKTAKKMGIETVAVFSEADREAPFVIHADEAYCIGPAPSSQSYLLIDRILEVALEAKADAIHPGYGFLSENAVFAKKVTDAGLVFIGPKPHAIEVMGSKLAAKDAVKQYNIPMVPGIDHAIDNPTEAIAVAQEIGYPILIKASAGGGGKGMRVVWQQEDIESEMSRAISEAQSAFGDGSVFIEKYVTNPRHIEIQVLADNHGNVVHLFERECSIQRRHQKVVEEAPSALLTDELRQKMGQAAVMVAKSCDYSGAGTVEFLMDDDHNFYFLEMNTRLQVEHPVTEMITGIDLVEQQILVARNEPLSFTQDDLSINGHAIELRIYAEDSYQNFAPSIGTLETYQYPTLPYLRVDDGYREGMNIPIYYDPMMAKLICHGKNRAEAIAHIKKALANTKIKGIETTIPFGEFVLNHEAFTSGNFSTQFVKKYFSTEALQEFQAHDNEAFAKIALCIYLNKKEHLNPISHNDDSWNLNR